MGETGETLRTLLFDNSDSFGAACRKTNISLSCDIPENFTKFTDRQSIASREDVCRSTLHNHSINGITFNSPQTTTQAGESSMHRFSIPGQILPNYTTALGFHSPPKHCANIPSVTDGNHYMPPRPASTPGNNFQNSSINDMNVASLANHRATSQTFQADVRPKTVALKHCPASFPQGLNQKSTHELQMTSLANKHRIHKLSEVPKCTASLSVSCDNPSAVSPVYQNSMSKLDSNTVFSHTSGHFMSPMTSVLHNVPVVDETEIFDGTFKNSGHAFKGQQFNTVYGNRLPSSGIPPTSQASGSFSSQLRMSDQNNTSHLISGKNVTQSYASLVPWTSKLTAPGYQPLPTPAVDAMPIPLENTERASMLSLSPSSRASRTRNLPIYSRLRPGMVNSDLNIMAKLKNGATRSPSQLQKVKCKALLNKEHRFKKTADALQKSGLWDVAMKTGNLIKRNQELQRELELFRADALAFLKSVIKNPQNRDFIKHVLNNALATNSCSSSAVMSVVVSAAAVAAASAELESCGSSSSCDSDSVADSHLNSTMSDRLSECSAPAAVAMDMK